MKDKISLIWQRGELASKIMHIHLPGHSHKFLVLSIS
ncbi:hypothetical protein COLO4_37619 [Corchorus olitorius]|uniref:Uncharacterized protein n=1 Tax=Corchorus olitorius TaxID=93759 RepID=A0A1R3G0F9_9ROSI|nr:hypothetical protein COLO4_37619 [Corchorus olitorius]